MSSIDARWLFADVTTAIPRSSAARMSGTAGAPVSRSVVVSSTWMSGRARSKRA
jgi:hypothetical protein